MANVICHICLRTDITAVNIDMVLIDFIDELCDYNIIENPRYKFCTICAHLLKKFYNFKQRCLKACKILKSLKGKPKILPTNLHEQIASSIGVCSSSARYKLVEYQHHTDIDLLETRSHLNIDPNITPNNAEVYSRNNLETADPILPDHIEVKDEPMHDVLDSNIETMLVADGENIYIINTNDGYLTVDGNFEKDTQNIKLETDKEELNSDTNQDGSKDNAKQKINTFLKSFEKEIKEFEDKSVHADDIEVKDTTSMFNNDPLRDDESLNSMDDIDSDIRDRDGESLNIDEQNCESDSDVGSLSDILEITKNKTIKVNEINDLELAEILLKVDRRNKLLKRRIEFLKGKANFKDDLLKLFENDEYDFGDGVKISKELFLKVYDRCESSYYNANNSKVKSDEQKIDGFLRYLYKMYNPEYETVFDIEYLDTEEKKLQEISRRKDRAEYQSAPYKCERCYKGFEIERVLANHMKKHDESSGLHECHLCFLRYPTKALKTKHLVQCHSAVYVCRLCQITFYYFDSMLNHFNMHKGVKYLCSICNNIYRTHTSLANHKRTHVTSHICTTCARSFVSAMGLANHRKRKHKGAPEPADASKVRCPECLLTLDSQNAYKRHLKISHSEYSYICSCFKNFSSMAELRQHKVDAGHQHANRKKRVNIGSSDMKSKGAPREKAAVKTCPVCQEEVPITFALSLYRHHERYHPNVPYHAEETNKVKKYLCEECGKRFIVQSQFLDHKNTHTGARPYQCPKCPRAFATATNLWNHGAWHRPPSHKCKLCGKLFQTKSNLSNHMRIHINDRRYICDVCSATFIHACALKEHIRGVHQQQRRVRKHKRVK